MKRYLSKIEYFAVFFCYNEKAIKENPEWDKRRGIVKTHYKVNHRYFGTFYGDIRSYLYKKYAW